MHMSWKSQQLSSSPRSLVHALDICVQATKQHVFVVALDSFFGANSVYWLHTIQDDSVVFPLAVQVFVCFPPLLHKTSPFLPFIFPSFLYFNYNCIPVYFVFLGSLKKKNNFFPSLNFLCIYCNFSSKFSFNYLNHLCRISFILNISLFKKLA